MADQLVAKKGDVLNSPFSASIISPSVINSLGSIGITALAKRSSAPPPTKATVEDGVAVVGTGGKAVAPWLIQQILLSYLRQNYEFTASGLPKYADLLSFLISAGVYNGTKSAASPPKTFIFFLKNCSDICEVGKIKGPKGFFADSVKAFMDSSWMECVVKFLANTINNMPNGEDKDEYLKHWTTSVFQMGNYTLPPDTNITCAMLVPQFTNEIVSGVPTDEETQFVQLLFAAYNNGVLQGVRDGVTLTSVISMFTNRNKMGCQNNYRCGGIDTYQNNDDISSADKFAQLLPLFLAICEFHARAVFTDPESKRNSEQAKAEIKMKGEKKKKAAATRLKKTLSALDQFTAALPELFCAMGVSESDVKMDNFGVGVVTDAESEGIRLLMLLANCGALPVGFVGLKYADIIANLFDTSVLGEKHRVSQFFERDGNIEGMFTKTYDRYDPIAAAKSADELKKLGKYLAEVAKYRRSEEFKDDRDYKIQKKKDAVGNANVDGSGGFGDTDDEQTCMEMMMGNLHPGGGTMGGGEDRIFSMANKKSSHSASSAAAAGGGKANGPEGGSVGGDTSTNVDSALNVSKRPVSKSAEQRPSKVDNRRTGRRTGARDEYGEPASKPAPKPAHGKSAHGRNTKSVIQSDESSDDISSSEDESTDEEEESPEEKGQGKSFKCGTVADYDTDESYNEDDSSSDESDS